MRKGANGREVVTDSEKPTSVYFVDPEDEVQVEVYDPSPEKAMSLAFRASWPPLNDRRASQIVISTTGDSIFRGSSWFPALRASHPSNPPPIL